MEDQISNTEPVQPAPTPAPSKPAESAVDNVVSKDQLLKVLTIKQQRALGLIPAAHQSDKVKARNEMMRERMKEFHRRKAEEKAKQAEEQLKDSAKASKADTKKRAPPPEVSEDESSDDYLQKKTKKIKTVVKTLSQVDERLRQLQAANQHNPYYKILMR